MVSHKDQYLDHCFFLVYINDLPKSVKDNAEVVLFADDTCIIVNSSNPIIFENTANKVFHYINMWFTINLVSLNVDETQFMQFVTKTSSLIDLNIFHGNKKNNYCS
jgi:hypothetical protein